jgi:pantothenate synthetase
VIPCPIVREADGLAMSSRNSQLSLSERARASTIAIALQRIAHLIKSRRKQSLSSYKKIFSHTLKLTRADKIEYFEMMNPEKLEPLKKISFPLLLAAAVWIGTTRLIDNIVIKEH